MKISLFFDPFFFWCAAREESDKFAIRSHALAKEAHEKGYFTDILSVRVPGKAAKSVDRFVDFGCGEKKLFLNAVSF